jgi:putative Mg2+ transporter-C (MgtC) family protein
MEATEQALVAARALLAAFLGAIIGWERESTGRDAGVRTYAAVSLGSCVCAALSQHLTFEASPHVIAAGVISGIGFIGAGVIMRDRGNITGLTTAASLWATAPIGLLVGYRLYVASILVSVIVLALLALQRLPHWTELTRPPEIRRSKAKRTAPRDTRKDSEPG